MTKYAPLLVASLLDVRVSVVWWRQAPYTRWCCHLLSKGRVYSFARGDYGKLGHGNTVAQLTPLVIAGLQGVRVRSVAAGYYTSLAGTTDGEVYGWGNGVGHDHGGELNPVLRLELTEDQLVPRKYPGLCLHV